MLRQLYERAERSAMTQMTQAQFNDLKMEDEEENDGLNQEEEEEA
jgi:hypothetical protein